MIRYTPASERKLSLFKTPFEQNLLPDNRWVKMAELVPWDDFASVLQKRMCKDNGRGSIDLRVVLGALLVKYVMNLSDEETIRYIQENIYVWFSPLKSRTEITDKNCNFRHGKTNMDSRREAQDHCRSKD